MNVVVAIVLCAAVFAPIAFVVVLLARRTAPRLNSATNALMFRACVLGLALSAGTSASSRVRFIPGVVAVPLEVICGVGMFVALASMLLTRRFGS